jgi:hypothetical protein
MVHYLPIKIINQIVSYFINQNNHPTMASPNQLVLFDRAIFFMLIILGILDWIF